MTNVVQALRIKHNKEKRTIKRNRSDGRNYLLPSRRRQKGARTRLWVTSVIKPLKTSGSHVARLTTCVAKNPWTSGGWTSRCLTRRSAGARSRTGGRRLKGLIHFGHGLKNVCLLLIRRKGHKIRFELLLRDR